MKLISNKATQSGTRIICEDVIFDPSLTRLIEVDTTESIVVLRYDALECGNPLNIPFQPARTELCVKLTQTGIHMYFLFSEFEDNEYLNEFCNDFGDLEFDVRMSEAEKMLLLFSISHHLMHK